MSTVVQRGPQSGTPLLHATVRSQDNIVLVNRLLFVCPVFKAWQR